MAGELEPLPPEGQILIYQDGGLKLQVRLDGQTVWLPQRLIADLFQVTVPTVNEHLKNVYEDGELDAGATIRKYRIVQTEGSRQVARLVDHYNLDAILAVGYRVRSARGTAFRQWATARLAELLIKGFTCTISGTSMHPATLRTTTTAHDWRVLSLREANVKLIDCDHRTPPATEVGYPYVAIPQLRNGHIDLSDARRISAEHFVDWTRKAKPTPNDVVLSRRCNPGETGFVDDGMEFALGQNLVLLRADGTTVYPAFLRWLLRGAGRDVPPLAARGIIKALDAKNTVGQPRSHG